MYKKEKSPPLLFLPTATRSTDILF